MSLSPAPVIPTGRLSHSAQPTLEAPDGALLSRPWAAADADVVHGAYQDAGIQRWSLRGMASRDEVLRWIAVQRPAPHRRLPGVNRRREGDHLPHQHQRGLRCRSVPPSPERKRRR
ncbi:hypothetical protein H8N00_16155 [Streptomyces sp. AC563]|uniref:hypothetical protein n=1 Tax=Streptomyces buecherae TaxID=2763006 RepID=UPI00164D0776|nr:hypothetical protein [Streptomyces buecherae]MBC3990381.1 hypothetical protein [Streptomyces buecherae]